MLQPILDRVIVAPIEEKTVGGLLVSRSEPPTVGTVVACGQGRKAADGRYIPLGFKVGDRVAYNASAGQAVPGKAGQLCMTEADILAVIES